MPRTTPLRREAAGLAYDAAIGKLVLFGGYACPGANCVTQDDTWTFRGRRWHRLHPETSPPPLLAPAMTYDPATGTILLFGGETCDPARNCTFSSDTWTFDGSTWTLRHPATSPPAMAASSVAFDRPTHRVVLFGGCSMAMCSGATWSWDGSDWTRLSPRRAPAPRDGAAMAPGPGGHPVLFGGIAAASSAMSDMWRWTGSNWMRVKVSPAPSPRAFAGMAFDQARHVDVLFGGDQRSCTVSTCTDLYLNDTWTFDGATWTQATPSSSPPTEQPYALAYDRGARRVVSFGGFGQFTNGFGIVVQGSPRDTYAWNGSDWLRIPSTVPQERESPMMAYDPARQTDVLFGGFCLFDACDTTWTWNGRRWREFSPPTPPDETLYEPMVYDPGTNSVMLELGSHVFAWGGSAWTDIQPPTSPSPTRRAFAMARDRLGDVVLFGGQSDGNDLGDTWIWNGTTWKEVHPPTRPPPREFAQMEYNPKTGQTVLFGGLADGGATYYNDTWIWDGRDWAERHPTHVPPSRAFFDMAYAPGAQGILMVGGLQAGAPGVLDDTWLWAGRDWRHRQSPGPDPLPRFGEAMAEFLPGNRVILFGGKDANPGRGESDTWAWRSG